MEEVSHCPLCGHPERRLFDRRTFRDQPVTNQRCLRCGLVYQSPRLTEEELSAFYQAEYRRLYQGNEGPSRRDLVVQRGRAEHLLQFIRARVPAPGRILDVGASSGALLARFASHFGATAVGVEPGAAYREHAQTQGLTVYPSLEDLLQAGEEPFDLVSMAHVLEHLADPVGFLARLREGLLIPGGWLLVEVPNLYCHNAFEVAHLTAFSPHTLKETVRKAGFQPLDLLRHGQPRSVVLPLYLTLLARPQTGSPRSQEATVQPERGVGLKRRAGLLRRRLWQRLLPDLAWLPMP